MTVRKDLSRTAGAYYLFDQVPRLCAALVSKSVPGMMILRT